MGKHLRDARAGIRCNAIGPSFVTGHLMIVDGGRTAVLPGSLASPPGAERAQRPHEQTA
jgi:hypothetical protein